MTNNHHLLQYLIINSRILISTVEESKDSLQVSVACSDIGNYVKFGGYQAKKLIDDFGGKTVVMGVLGHENSDVRFQALAAVQKIMLNSF